MEDVRESSAYSSLMSPCTPRCSVRRVGGGGWVNLPAAIIYDRSFRTARLILVPHDPMKKKSPRGIPDFSSKGPKSALPMDRILREKAPKPTFDQPKVKPAATNQKSGRRGA